MSENKDLKVHEKLAKDCFNKTWELLDKKIEPQMKTMR